MQDGPCEKAESVLKSFFELPDVFETSLKFCREAISTSTPIYSLLQGTLWRNVLKNFAGKVVFPILLYFDDFETGNPLGSRAGVHKLGAVYFSLPCLPQYLLTKLNNIFLALLFHSQDRESNSDTDNKKRNKFIFNRLINELNFLSQKGIDISLKNGRKQKIFFVLTQIIGDNLGLNSILGFVESFAANHYCRICNLNKSEMKKITIENTEAVRNPDSYNSDLKKEQLSETGIKEECVWNAVRYFHVAINFSVDIMHDLAEGVARYEMAKIIYYFISKEYFTFQFFLSKLKYFDYSPNDNKVPPISFDDLLNGMLIMSAAEMNNLVMYFGLMVGNYVPNNDEVWQLYILLRKIFEIANSRVLQKSCYDIIVGLIEEHHDLYLKIFKDDLKPKYHFLLHYGRIFELAGPLCNISSERFEANHKNFKEHAHQMRCRKNLTYSLSLYHQIFFSNRLQVNESINSDIIAGPSIKASTEDLTADMHPVEQQKCGGKQQQLPALPFQHESDPFCISSLHALGEISSSSSSSSSGEGERPPVLPFFLVMAGSSVLAGAVGNKRGETRSGEAPPAGLPMRSPC
ncbi:hypothetical protein B566_EDAN013571 [Ephemera danica]|nr:hypothetical protein B566_EDAN013571 [Ephemera danica]